MSRAEHYINSNGTAEYHLYELPFGLNKRHELTSPSFPFCCKSGVYMHRQMAEAEGRTPCYIRLQFHDLNLPKNRQAARKSSLKLFIAFDKKELRGRVSRLLWSRNPHS